MGAQAWPRSLPPATPNTSLGDRHNLLHGQVHVPQTRAPCRRRCQDAATSPESGGVQVRGGTWGQTPQTPSLDWTCSSHPKGAAGPLGAAHLTSVDASDDDPTLSTMSSSPHSRGN